MKGDFSRDTFDPARAFSRVLIQQGRVQLDADWNEQAGILLHYLRTLAADLIGPCAGPKDDWGFDISATTTDGKPDLAIGSGRYYVDGFLCENEEEGVRYLNQPHYPCDSLDSNRPLLVYLDVWERHVTSIEDDSIREKALGGPDTATRAQVVWQVKTELVESVGDLASKKDESDIWKNLVEGWQPVDHGMLKVRLKPEEMSTDPCTIPPRSAYRGQENQLYRVEIHTEGAAGTATFKWSRDNGSVVAAWLDTDGNDLLVDSTRRFEGVQWVELLDDTWELRSEPGTLVKVTKVEAGIITIDPTTASGSINRADFPRHPRVRRWDQQDTEEITLQEGAVVAVESASNWIDLEHGIQVQFQPGATWYRTGDYWLIPARTNGTIEWPFELDANGQIRLVDGNLIPIEQPPHGIEHHYAPLAIAQDSVDPIDLRCKIPPARECP